MNGNDDDTPPWCLAVQLTKLKEQSSEQHRNDSLVKVGTWRLGPGAVGGGELSKAAATQSADGMRWEDTRLNPQQCVGVIPADLSTAHF
jgi:hypothetical protein